MSGAALSAGPQFTAWSDYRMRLLEQQIDSKRERERERLTHPRARARQFIGRNVTADMAFIPKHGGRSITIPVATVRAVLLALAHEVKGDGYATASYADVARRAGRSKRTCMRVLLTAERLRIVEVSRRRIDAKLHADNAYRFIVPNPVKIVPIQGGG